MRTGPRRPSFRAQRSGDPESRNSPEAHGFEAFGKQIRDNFIRMRDLMSEARIFKLLIGKKAEKAIDEWDELAVDCKVGADEEFRRLVLKIAERA